MSQRDEEEERARAWLRERGYETERPTWLPTGRNPDFWASTTEGEPRHVWVEVKSTGKDGGEAALDEHHDTIAAATIPPGLHGQAIFHLSPKTARQSVERLLKRFAREAPRYVGRRCTLAFIQQVRDKVDARRAEIASAEPETIWVFGSEGGPLLAQAGLICESGAEATVFDQAGVSKTGRAFHFFEWARDPECALVVRLDPNDRALNGITCMSGGAVPFREKTVGALEGANDQIKTACVHRPAPGIVLLVPQGRSASALMAQAACYGQLMVPVRLGRDGELASGEMQHGRDGVFRPDKNRHLSAAVLLEASGTATYFPNPWAHRPINETASIFNSAERARIR